MSKHVLRKCAECGSQMVPRTIYRKSVGFGGVVPGASFCPICQSTNWQGSSGFFDDLHDAFQLHPGLTLFAVIAFIPIGLAVLASGLILLLSGGVIVLGLLSGEGLPDLVSKVDAGGYLFIFLGGLACVGAVVWASLPYIPWGLNRRRNSK